MKIREQTCTIALRVPVSWRERYEQEAAARGRTLSEHVRAKLDSAEGASEPGQGLDDLREAVAEALGKRGGFGGNDVDRGLLLEAVLRLRGVSNPQTSNWIYPEIERNRLPVWKGYDPRDAVEKPDVRDPQQPAEVVRRKRFGVL